MREIPPPYQRLMQRRREDRQQLTRVADAQQRFVEKQNEALKRWANPMDRPPSPSGTEP